MPGAIADARETIVFDEWVGGNICTGVESRADPAAVSENSTETAAAAVNGPGRGVRRAADISG